ncbi:MAG TPA: VOC family protein [Planctomycetes bacterium]|nr:VOC family protein [Planctomycetota bacterium]
MRLGKFSISLDVKDLAASREFYEKLGFEMTNGDGETWVVLRNGTTTLGLFHGMLPRNTLTFNPGWDSTSTPLADFDDVRELQKTLVARGLAPDPMADEDTTGPAFFMLTDPDGNPILIDQHVPSPKK